jgi:hypothetical protein
VVFQSRKFNPFLLGPVIHLRVGAPEWEPQGGAGFSLLCVTAAQSFLVIAASRFLTHSDISSKYDSHFTPESNSEKWDILLDAQVIRQSRFR